MLHIPRFPNRSKKIEPLSPKEAKLVLTYTPQPYKCWFQFALLSELRTGEMMALGFDDFDLVEGILKIRRSRSRGALGSTKSFSSDRDIPLFSRLLKKHSN